MGRTFFRATPPPHPHPCVIRCSLQLQRHAVVIPACPSGLALSPSPPERAAGSEQALQTRAEAQTPQDHRSHPGSASQKFCVKCLCQCGLTRTKGAEVPSGQRVCFRELCCSCEEPFQPHHDLKCDKVPLRVSVESANCQKCPLKCPRRCPRPPLVPHQHYCCVLLF